MKVHVVDIEPGDTPESVAQDMAKRILKANPELKNRRDRDWMTRTRQEYLVGIKIETEMSLFPLVRELRKHLQNFMDENKILNDPMVFTTNQFRKVEDKYTHFEGIENGSGYREWCSYDKGEGY
jgi:hypothetical protein